MTNIETSWKHASARHRPSVRARRAALETLLLACALAGWASGCGGKSDDADSDETGETADGLEDAAAADDADPTEVGVGDGSTAGEDATTSDADAAPTVISCKSDKDCLAGDRVCDKAASVCVQCNDADDCGDDETCKGHVCVGPAKACASSKECAATNQLCDKVAGICVDCLSADDCAAGQGCLETVCVDVVCKPGVTACKDATTLGVCAADGLGVVEVTCPAGQGCAGGLCTMAAVCKPGASACEGAATLLSCNADGSAWIKTPCDVKHLCATKGGLSLCEAATCTPGSLVCVGDKIAECSSSGEPSDISDDCALKGKVCDAGSCVAKPVDVCTAGSKACDGDKAKVCKADASDWEVVDCTTLGQICDAGDCVAKVVTVCTAGAVGCDGPNKAVCKADGTGWNLVGCGPKAACNAGVCEPTLCTPYSQDCVDAKTQKTCAADGKSWIDVTACSTTNVCAESACKAGVGCTMTPYADGASCGDGKICSGGTCNAPTGCQLCGPTEACVSGQCQACTVADVPVYVGAVRTFLPPAQQLPGPIQLAYSPKHAEWWVVYNHQQGKPGKIVRYNKDWSATGKEFEIPPYSRSLAVLPDGDFVMAIIPTSGSSWVKRFKALSQDVVWATEVKWGDFGVAGVSLWQGKILTNVGLKFSNGSRWATLDPDTGAKLTEKQYSSDGGVTGVSSAFVIGDNLYGPSSTSMQRWLLAPVLAPVTFALVTPPWYGATGASFSHGAIDGRYACIGMNSWFGRLFCYDFYPTCGAPPTQTLPFPGSTLLSSDEQDALAKLLGAEGKVWTRCSPTLGKPGFANFASACSGGPTVVIGGQTTVTNGKSAFIGAYSSTGWSQTNGTKVSDSKAFLFSLPGGTKAVPQSGIATLTTNTSYGPLIEGGLTCTKDGCKYELKSFACDDGSSTTNCQSKLNPSLMANQGFNEVWVLKP